MTDAARGTETLGLFVSRWASLITLDELAGAVLERGREPWLTVKKGEWCFFQNHGEQLGT